MRVEKCFYFIIALGDPHSAPGSVGDLGHTRGHLPAWASNHFKFSSPPVSRLGFVTAGIRTHDTPFRGMNGH